MANNHIARSNFLRMTSLLVRFRRLTQLEELYYDGRDQKNWHGALDDKSFFALLSQRKASRIVSEVNMHYRNRDKNLVENHVAKGSLLKAEVAVKES